MKLLLTSGGIKNNSIAKALEDLAGKPLQDSSLAFIPTAVNISANDKHWLIVNYSEFKAVKFFDVVDIAALTPEQFLPRLEKADIIVVGGGNFYFLMDWIVKLELYPKLAELLETRVYVGISAGSIIASKTIWSLSKKPEFQGQVHHEGDKGLGFVDFHIIPHLNSPDSPHATEENIARLAEKIKETIYGLDEQSALKIVDDHVETISEGKVIVFGNN